MLLFLLPFITRTIVAFQVVPKEHDVWRPWTAVGENVTCDVGDLSKKINLEVNESSLPNSLKYRLSDACTGEQEKTCGERECVTEYYPSTTRLGFEADEGERPYGAYRCECERNEVGVEYIDQAGGLSVKYECVPRLQCDHCNAEHTVRCLRLGNGQATCLCEPEYTGEKCDLLKDGCAIPHDSASLPGDEACLVNKGNECKSVYQSLMYMCLCHPPYSEDKRLSFPNCMKNTTDTEIPVCLGFRPPPAESIPGPSIVMDSLHLGKVRMEDNNTICDCPDGWLGPHCTEERGESVLGSWSPWSTCNPDCILPTARMRYKQIEDLNAGMTRTTGIGYRSRFSRCNLDASDFCVGTFRFWRRCRVTSLCNSWTGPRLSTVVNEAIAEAMSEHDRANMHDRMDPIITTAAELSWEETHYANFIALAAALVFTCFTIWALELHYTVLYWSNSD
ncbi:unnamed protein product [Calicophoron daubneyi]|uniref:EGF-like domain-containing protein n=1 Tax=Calicophoron daubneyi TaxID=300641 RepID=A0AAV2TYR3_CALDB